MTAASIGSIIRSFVNGVIVLNEEHHVLWYDVNEKIHLKISEGIHISEIIMCENVKFIDNERFPVTTNEQKLIIEVKNCSSDKQYTILCIEEISNLISNPKFRLYCLEKIVESLDEGVMMSNHKGEIVLYNGAQEKMEGLNSHEIIGMPLWSAYNYNSQYSEHKHTFKTGKPIFSRYSAHSKVDGIPKYVNYSTFPIQKDGEIIAVFFA